MSALTNVAPVSRPSWKLVLVSCLVAIAVGATAGAVAAFGGALVLLALLGAGAILFLAAAPLWVFAPLALLATVLSDVARVELGDAPQAALLGQGRLIALLGGVVLLRVVLMRERLLFPKAVIIPVVIYAASLVLSALVAGVSGRLDLSDLIRSASYMLAFPIGYVVASRPHYRLIAMRVVAVLVVFGGAVGLLYWMWTVGVQQGGAAMGIDRLPQGLLAFFERIRVDSAAIGLDPLRSRMPWVDHHPNRVAVIFVLLGAMTIPSLLHSRYRGDAVLGVLTTAAVTAGVLATQSRTGLIVLAVALAVYWIGWILRARLAGQLFGIAAAVAFIPMFMVMVTNLLPDARPLARDAENLQSREAIWGDALSQFVEAPILGQGLNYAGGGEFVFGLSAHNEYLGKLVDGGLVGLLAFLVLLGAFLYVAWAISRRSGADGWIGLGALMYLAVLLVSMVVATTWRTSAPVIISWLYLGMLTAIYVRPGIELSRDRESGSPVERDGVSHAPSHDPLTDTSAP